MNGEQLQKLEVIAESLHNGFIEDFEVQSDCFDAVLERTLSRLSSIVRMRRILASIYPVKRENNLAAFDPNVFMTLSSKMVTDMEEREAEARKAGQTGTSNAYNYAAASFRALVADMTLAADNHPAARNLAAFNPIESINRISTELKSYEACASVIEEQLHDGTAFAGSHLIALGKTLVTNLRNIISEMTIAADAKPIYQSATNNPA